MMNLWSSAVVFGFGLGAGVAHAQSGLMPFLTDGPRVVRSQAVEGDPGANLQFVAPSASSTRRDTHGFMVAIWFDTAVAPLIELSRLAEWVESQYGSQFGFDGHTLDWSKQHRVMLTPETLVITVPVNFGARRLLHTQLEIGLVRDSEGMKVRHLRRRGEVWQETFLPVASSASVIAPILADMTYTIQATEALIIERAGGLLAVTAFAVATATNVYTIYVDDESGKVFEAFEHRYHLDRPVLSLEVFDRSYLDEGLMEYPLPFTSYTNGADAFETAGNGTLATDVLPSLSDLTLSNRRVRVRLTGNNSIYRLINPEVTEQGAILTSGNDRLASNTYAVINRANQFVRRYIKATEVAYLDQPISVAINVAGSCNAFYDGAISLFSAGNGCSNMAQVNDVIVHEWGHGLDDFTGSAVGIQDGAFSEGIGDIIAAYYFNSPNMGQGFFTGSNTGIRNLVNNARYPEDVGEVHDEGRIISGAFWDMRVALMSRYGDVRGSYHADMLFFRHLLVANTYLDSYEIILTVDDDDGNPATPSPNHCLINAAFARHGLAQDEGCTDAVDEPAIPVDPTLSLVVIDRNDAPQLLLSMEAEDNEELWVCRGTAAVSCSNDLNAQVEGISANGARIIYISDAFDQLSEHDYVTLVRVGVDGKRLGKRQFKLVSH